MTPLERLRIEKAATDCGFEMTPELLESAIRLRSARFPEDVLVSVGEAGAFEVTASNPLLLDVTPGSPTLVVNGYPTLYAVLHQAAARARTLPNRVADAFRRQTASMPRSTEVERLVLQRVGQDLFRAALMDYWQGKCCVTGLAVPELLRASHIKPWAACENDDERLDVHNGLLLAPHIDALFDGGWISFTDDGAMEVSGALPTPAWAQLHLSDESRVVGLQRRHAGYLAFHRAHCLRRAS